MRRKRERKERKKKRKKESVKKGRSGDVDGWWDKFLKGLPQCVQ